MKRLSGYYWVQIHPLYAGTTEPVWIVALYREINSRSLWLAPGLAQPLTDDHFQVISPNRLDTPVTVPVEQSIIWTP